MARAHDARISSRLVASLLLAWNEMGLDVGAIVDGSGVERGKLDDPDAFLSPEEVGGLGVAAFALSGDPLLSLHTAERYRPGSIPVIDYLVLSAPTLQEAIERYARYDRILQNVSVTTLEVKGDTATLRHESTGLTPTNPPASENALASAVVFGRHLTTTPSAPLEVRLMHAAPPDTTEHERVFGAPVKFSQPDNAVVFPADALQRPMPRADAGMFAALQRHAEELLRQVADGERTTTAGVRRVATRLLPDGDASLPKVAKALEVSERTLRRRLSDEGTSFRQVIEGVQRQLACDHLRRDELAIDELSLILGFSDGRAFRRAFKRWYGESPAEYRRRHRR